MLCKCFNFLLMYIKYVVESLDLELIYLLYIPLGRETHRCTKGYDSDCIRDQVRDSDGFSKAGLPILTCCL